MLVIARALVVSTRGARRSLDVRANERIELAPGMVRANPQIR